VTPVSARPACAVRVAELPGEARPRLTPGGGAVRSWVRAVGNAAGLTRMGVWHRTVPPGFAGTHRHFHELEEEWTYVLAGEGVVRVGPHRLPVRAGSFAAFPPGPRPHHFVNTGAAPLVLLEGGERRPREDRGWYVDVPRRWQAGRFLDDPGAPPPEQGDPAQVVHVDDLEETVFQHDVDPAARRVMRSLTRAAGGLARQAVRWTRVAAGSRSTAYHSHDRTDEWIFLLEGRASVRVGDARFEAEAGDFLGHPAGGPPHAMEPRTDLTYLMGGMVDPDDVVTYPDAGVQRVGGVLVPGPGGAGGPGRVDRAG
jgi:quercetin 2,3-dioxygenase